MKNGEVEKGGAHIFRIYLSKNKCVSSFARPLDQLEAEVPRCPMHTWL